ncbi:hypothetical protein ACFVMC_01030 [Nocardia sp. NPDC127579]|uniref:hypothetical protein n=1 Tax=Nocardia sp. NPDC127579 TaxID=3345402 RepID=UPI00363FD6AD
MKRIASALAIGAMTVGAIALASPAANANVKTGDACNAPGATLEQFQPEDNRVAVYKCISPVGSFYIWEFKTFKQPGVN